MMNSKERIEYLVKCAGGRAEVARKLGKKYQTINSWYSSGNVSMSCIRCIHTLLPNVNLAWLIFGEGDIEIYGKEYERTIRHLESLGEESEKLKKAINEKIGEIRKFNERNTETSRN